MDATPIWIAGTPEHGTEPLTVTHPYDGSEAGATTHATEEQVERAVAAAAAVAREAASLPAHVRAAALDHVSRRLAERHEEVARLITAENGKPITWARVEVTRAIGTFRWAAEEARRFDAVTQDLSADPGMVGRLALTRRVPLGPVLGISPFNFPLNLVAHKIAPAIAVGAPIVVKPAPATPLSALLLGELLAETDLPAGMVSVIPVPNDRAPGLVADPRLPVVSFTGSVPVGWSIAESVPRKKTVLELGGNAAALVCPDWSSEEDLEWAATRIATFGNYQAGQSCIAVQRVFVAGELYDDLVARVVTKVGALKDGDPSEEDVVVGPLVDLAAAERVESWVGEAVAAGARVLVGGNRYGTAYEPTVLADVPPGAKVSAEEVFGPVLTVSPVSSVDEGFAAINDSRFGLQAGVFTHDVAVAFRAHRELAVGGVIVGDVPSFRADQMAYGGTKDSGAGREGLRAAMEDLTETRVLVLRTTS
ncbi:aldehyde dehydrogenase [Actinorhabdospora filicis]|uniref:Aldehyde dehydrogenase n=1 Tax=Actinorhabdospora filicis TaxID=1785913 RepID=A0A9W6WBR3_9ACTN|nr:aldehyde dehydrogenase family protein [Actinorhabdospora filicis]GLZ80884.1 aldehyde dehydrogenase [Actinorhabdospora filicis]